MEEENRPQSPHQALTTLSREEPHDRCLMLSFVVRMEKEGQCVHLYNKKPCDGRLVRNSEDGRGVCTTARSDNREEL